MRRYLGSLVASLAIHGALVVAVMTALPRSEVLPALFVDLTVGAGATPPVESSPPPRASSPSRISRSAQPERAPAPAAAKRSPGAALPQAFTPPPNREPAVPPSVSSPEPAVAPPVAAAPPQPTPVPGAPSPALPDDAAATIPVPFPPASSERQSPAPSASSERESPPMPSASTALSDAGGAVQSPGPVAAESNGRGALADVPDAGHADRAASAPGASGPGQQHARRSPATESGEGQAAYTEYLGGLRQRIHEALRYPPAARRRGLTGAVTLELTILPSGVIRDVSVVESSSHAILDEAALDTVRALRAQPFPRNVPPRTLRVRLPVVFQLQ